VGGKRTIVALPNRGINRRGIQEGNKQEGPDESQAIIIVVLGRRKRLTIH
jgi:hypothetical protein